MVDVEDLSWVFYAAIIILSLLLSGTLLLLASAPTQYNPYDADLVEATAHEKDNDRKLAPNELYAAYNIPDNVSVQIRRETTVQIVVLGDIGRSPRMQYHALSFAKHGAKVELIGFKESEIHPSILASPLITIVPLRPSPRALQTSNPLLFLLLSPLKVLHQTLSLYHTLSYLTLPAQWMLVQNPPSIPLLAIAKLVCLIRNTTLVIDWHNLGYSLLALKLGPRHPVVRLAKVYEHIAARTATAHICVTHAMARLLARSMHIQAHALHDRPAALFQPVAPTERKALLERLPPTAAHAAELASGKWKLLVSSTSWTADEDFSLLLSALVGYCARATSDPSRPLPYILAVITGKGPLKAHYLSQIAELSQAGRLSHASVVTAWLSAEGYAGLLGVADLGVSLHMSSSGVDLPMKVVDMFGAGLPVVGWGEYEAWPELVREGENGRGFGSVEELERMLCELFGGDGEQLMVLKRGAMEEGRKRWDGEWDEVAGREVFRVIE